MRALMRAWVTESVWASKLLGAWVIAKSVRDPVGLI
jgi:hypothetical protein